MSESTGIEQDFRTRLSRLRWGIALAWVLNVVTTTLTVEAAIVATFLSVSSSNKEIVEFLLSTLPIALLVSLVVVTILSFIASRRIPAMTSGDLLSAQKHFPQVYNVVEEMCVAAGVPYNQIPDVYVANDVRTPNAYAISWSSGSRIVFTRGIVDLLSREELQAVAAHELGHITSGDSKAMTKLIAMSSIVGLVSSAFSRIMFGRNNNNGGANIVAIVLVVASYLFLLFAPLISAVSQAFMSRKRESQADATAVDYTRNPSALITALKKISGNQSDDSQSKKFNKNARQLAFFSDKTLRTHPPTEDRISALVSMGGREQE